MKNTMRILTLMLAALFVVGMFAACSNTPASTDTDKAPVSSGVKTDAAPTDSASTDTASATDTQQAGITITVDVINSKEEKTTFTITTTAENLRGALEQINLIEGDEGEYGLYVKVVNGERADYDTDHAFWSFSKNGEMLMTGVDSTPIADGEHYEITYTKSE